MTAEAFRTELDRMLAGAEAGGQSSLSIAAGDLHRRVGGYPGADHRMPNCCRVMREAMQDGRDEVESEPESGAGASLTIRYALPRRLPVTLSEAEARGGSGGVAVRILHEISNRHESGWTLCFQWCRYDYSDPDQRNLHGYRFIWRRPDGTLQAARGQARIPSLAEAMELMARALREGWGDERGEE